MVDCVSCTNSTDDLVQRQKENEERILDGGIKEYQRNIAEAKAKGNFSQTLPGQWLLGNFIDPIRVKIKIFVQDSLEGKAGRKPAGARILGRLRYDACAFLAVRTAVDILNRASSGEQLASFVRRRIAHELIDELQFNYMEVERTQTYQYWMDQIKRAPNRVTKKRCKDRLLKNFESIPDFKSEEEQVELEAAAEFLLRTVCTATGFIETFAKAEPKRNKGGQITSFETPLYLRFTPQFYKTVQALNNKAESLWPKYEPMVCPPKPWTGAFGGGFIGKLGERTKLIRTGNRSYLEDIHNNIDKMDKVLTALNAVQATPWRINKRIFAVMKEAFLLTHSEAYALPIGEELPLPPKPEDADTDKKVMIAHVGKIKAIQAMDKKRESKWKTTDLMLRTAERYIGESAIWFAHNLDWRGRIYPLSSYLSPQGDELHHALLEFANGLALETDEAVEWLAVHGAGCWGNDKVSFAERFRWVRENERHIRGSVEAPLDYRWWVEADKPWMFLAWCFDWVDYLNTGKAHVSHLPVAMDGSCNGLQNFAAMLRHEGTARAVNLVPSEKPSDIYQQVADKVIPQLELLAARDPRTDAEIKAEAETRTILEFADKDRTAKARDAVDKQIKAGTLSKKEGAALKKGLQLQLPQEYRQYTTDLWNVLAARWIKDHVTRKVVKRPVMTYPYSVTLFGIKEQLLDTLSEMDYEGVTSYPSEHIAKVAGMLRDVVFEAIQETVVAAAQAMEWLRAAAEVVAEGNLPVTWVSPIGMLVMQNYWKSTTKRISVTSGGIQYQPTINIAKVGEVAAAKQAAGVAPNFVHSCDASHLMYTILACRGEGVGDFHMIHDSYGTHVRNASTLARTLREQFVRIYSGNVLMDFYSQLKSQVADRPELADSLPLPPEQGDFDLSQVLESKFFFA